ncbi:MTTase N-terminal domain-containing protein [Haematococcus lacustris]|uniref:MTTase N-terminal domain-containing protein n=1 Tax=Haematococcus lacustris TaxID=44745 RepID=A0A699ZDX8_HAELA|nr:MTTase N-terminal domain-containing protein [Haematococcus lacustris]
MSRCTRDVLVAMYCVAVSRGAHCVASSGGPSLPSSFAAYRLHSVRGRWGACVSYSATFRGFQQQHPSGVAHVRRYGSRCSATLTGHPAPTIAAPPPPQTARPKVSLVALGCPKNTVDGEVLLGDLQRTGFDITTDHSDADAVLVGSQADSSMDRQAAMGAAKHIVVNTCAFVEDAKAESLEAIMAAAALNADGKQRRIVVTGCLAQRYAEQLAADLPEANLVSPGWRGPG